MDVSVTTTQQGVVATVVRVLGDVDMAGAQPLAAAFDSAMKTGHTIVIVDLGGATFFDSAGLSGLETLRQGAESAGVRLLIACPHERILKLFRITSLDRGLAIYPSLTAAMDAAAEVS